MLLHKAQGAAGALALQACWLWTLPQQMQKAADNPGWPKAQNPSSSSQGLEHQHPQVVFTMTKRILKLIAGVATQILMVLTALSAEAAPTESCLLAASPGAH